MEKFRDLWKLPHQIWVLFFAVLVNRMGTMALPFLVLYLTDGLHYTKSTAGLMLGLYGLGALVIAPITGSFCDRVGAIRMMLISLFSSAAVLAIFPLAQGTPALAVATLALAVTNEPFRPASLTAVSEFVAPAQRKAAFALIRLAINLGMSIGPAIGGFLATYSFSSLFWANAFATFVAGVVLAKAVRPGESAVGASGAAPESIWSSLMSSLADRRLRNFSLALLPVVFVFFQHESTLPLFMVEDLKLRESYYGLLFTINTVIIIFLEIPLNLYTSHWSHRKAMAIGSFLFALGFGVLPVVTDFGGVALTVVIWTFGEMILFPAASAFVSDISPPGRHGAYMGVYALAFNFTFVIGPAGGSLILQKYGASPLWIFCLLLGMLSALMMLGTNSAPKLNEQPT